MSLHSLHRISGLPFGTQTPSTPLFPDLLTRLQNLEARIPDQMQRREELRRLHASVTSAGETGLDAEMQRMSLENVSGGELDREVRAVIAGFESCRRERGVRERDG